jgi:hypothetical protein
VASRSRKLSEVTPTRLLRRLERRRPTGGLLIKTALRDAWSPESDEDDDAASAPRAGAPSRTSIRAFEDEYISNKGRRGRRLNRADNPRTKQPSLGAKCVEMKGQGLAPGILHGAAEPRAATRLRGGVEMRDA